MKKWVNVFTGGVLATSIWASPILAADSLHDVTKEDSSTLPQPYGDMANHWATDNVTKWSHRGVVSGVENARFEPNRPITRSEWAALLNRAFQIQPGQAVSFTDVNKDDWFAPTVTDAVYAGYMKGFEDGSFRPTQGLSREEAAVTVNQLLQIPSSDTNKTFKDSASLHNWSQKAVNAVVAAGIIEGYQDGTFQPKKSLTRAEAVTILDRAVDHFGAWYGESGTYGPSTGLAKQAGNVVINTTGVTLQNTEIAGDLIIGKAVGKGDVFLKNVKVHGKTYVYGGGENGLHLNNSALVSIIVNNVDGTVRLVAEGGATSISEIKIKTGAALDVSQGASVNRVTLTNELPTKSNVSLTGYFHTVNVEAFATNVNIPNGQIDTLNVADNATGTTIDIAKESSILSLVLHAATKVIGLGSVDKAIVNAENVSFQTKPKSVTNGDKVGSNVKVTIGNSTNTLGSQGTTSSGGGGGSSSNSNESDKSKNEDKKDNNPQTQENNSGDFKISVPKRVVAVGEAVYFTSPRDGVAYFSNNSIDNESITSLESGIESGEVQKIEVQANKTVSFSTYAINHWSFRSNYKFNLTVYYNNGGDSEVITVLDENKAIVENPETFHYLAWENELDHFSFDYNRFLQLADGKTTEDIVQWSVGDGPFTPFTKEDGAVRVENNKVFILPKHLEDRLLYNFRLVTGSVVTSNGEFNKEFQYRGNRKTVRITMIQPIGDILKVKKGGGITFSLSDVSDVYLQNTSVGDWGKKITVTDDEVNKPVTISTSELPPGNYTLYVSDGQFLDLEIIE